MSQAYQNMQGIFSFNLGVILLAILHGTTYCNGAYEAGSPGADWSNLQSEIVMEKLLKLMHDPEKAIKDMVPKNERKANIRCNDRKECANPVLPEVKNILGDEKYLDMIYGARSYRNIQQSYSNIWPDMPKFVRLTFHDCVKEGDGKSGCNG